MIVTEDDIARDGRITLGHVERVEVGRAFPTVRFGEACDVIGEESIPDDDPIEVVLGIDWHDDVAPFVHDVAIVADASDVAPNIASGGVIVGDD